MIDKVPETVRKRPQPKGGSRKGKPNKATALIKEMIEGALHDVGGKDYLVRQAKKNPVAFMGLLKAILPKDVTLSSPGGTSITVEVIKRIVDNNQKHT